MIMSTHSLDVLTSLLELQPEDTSVLLLKKTKDDILIHENLTLDKLEDIIETSQDPRRLADSLRL